MLAQEMIDLIQSRIVFGNGYIQRRMVVFSALNTQNRLESFFETRFVEVKEPAGVVDVRKHQAVMVLCFGKFGQVLWRNGAIPKAELTLAIKIHTQSFTKPYGPLHCFVSKLVANLVHSLAKAHIFHRVVKQGNLRTTLYQVAEPDPYHTHQYPAVVQPVK